MLVQLTRYNPFFPEEGRGGIETESATDTRATTDNNDPFLNTGFKHGKKWVDKNGANEIRGSGEKIKKYPDFGQIKFDLWCGVCVCVSCVAWVLVSRFHGVGFHVWVLVSSFGHVRCPWTALPWTTLPVAALPRTAAGASHDSPRTPKRAHVTAPALQTPPKFHERDKKSANGAGERKKKREFQKTQTIDSKKPKPLHFFETGKVTVTMLE